MNNLDNIPGTKLTVKCKIAKILGSEASFPAAGGEMFSVFAICFHQIAI